MKTTINFNDFYDAFNKADRSDNFTYQGLKALFNYLENFENEIGEEMELDVIGLCCQFVEYPSFEAIQEDYNVIDLEKLEYNTTVIDVRDGDAIIGYIVEAY